MDGGIAGQSSITAPQLENVNIELIYLYYPDENFHSTLRNSQNKLKFLTNGSVVDIFLVRIAELLNILKKPFSTESQKELKRLN